MTHSRKSWNLHTTLRSVLSHKTTTSRSIQMREGKHWRKGYGRFSVSESEQCRKYKKYIVIWFSHRQDRSMNRFILTMVPVNWTELILFVLYKNFLLSPALVYWASTLRYLIQISGSRIFYQFFPSRFTCFCTLLSIIASVLIIICTQKGVFLFFCSLFATFDHKIIET